MKQRLMLMVLLAAFFAGSVQAADLFTLTATTPEETASISFNAIEDIVAAVDNESLQDLLASYSATSEADIALSIRGLPATVNYAADSNTLIFEVPSLDIYQEFTGADRDASQQLFEDFLEEDGDGILKKMLQELAATTAIDPVAGNPNSLMAGMGAADFSNGTDIAGGQVIGGISDLSADNMLSIGVGYGSYSAGDYDQTVYRLPIKYAIRFDSDPRKMVIVDLPISYVDTEGGKSYTAAFGLGVRLPLTDAWSLTPALRIGAAGSVDLGSAAVIYSGTLTSNYNLYWDDIRVSIGNMVGQYQTSSIDAGDYSIDYDLANTMIKNGVGVEVPLAFGMFGNPASWQVDVTHTALSGDDLYIDNYMDISASFGSRATKMVSDNLRIGVSYTTGNHSYHGISGNLIYHF